MTTKPKIVRRVSPIDISDRGQLRQAAKNAAARVHTLDEDVVLPRDRFKSYGNFPDAGEFLSRKQLQDYQLAEMQFFDFLREELLVLTGRWLATVRGEGMRLLTIPNTVESLPERAYDKALEAISKATRRLNIVRNHLKNSEERARIQDQLNRLTMTDAAIRLNRSSSILPEDDLARDREQRPSGSVLESLKS